MKDKVDQLAEEVFSEMINHEVALARMTNKDLGSAEDMILDLKK